jgi:hypothetical protein
MCAFKDTRLFGRACFALEFFARNPDNEDGPARVMTYWNLADHLPTKYEAFDWADQLLERQEFHKLHLNVSLRDSDFDAANPAYGFLIFPRMPQLDRFLTGRE